MDLDDTGTLSMHELKTFMKTNYLDHIVTDATLAAIADCIDTEGDGELDYTELVGLLETGDIMSRIPPPGFVKKKSQKMIERETPFGNRGCTIADLKFAQTTIKERLMMINNSILSALRDVDEDGSGIITRDEMKAFLREYHILEYTDTYGSGADRVAGTIKRGDLSEAQVDTLLDYVDFSGDGQIDYVEFTKVLIADDILNLDQRPAQATFGLN